jgi:hypothetical protein
MQENSPSDPIRSELLERLKALEEPAADDSLADLAYRRAREALEKALDEARTIRLQAIEDARNNRERELSALMESLGALRRSAQAQIESFLREAEIEAERIRDEARTEARVAVEQAEAVSTTIRADADAIRIAAEERARAVTRLEADFDAQLERIGKRLGMQKPKKGFFRR